LQLNRFPLSEQESNRLLISQSVRLDKASKEQEKNVRVGAIRGQTCQKVHKWQKPARKKFPKGQNPATSSGIEVKAEYF
jgi:hypothetical protein